MSLRSGMQDNKIVFFLGGMRRGGAERVFTVLSKEFLNRGYKVTVCVLLFNDWEYKVDDRIEKVNMSGNTQSRIKRVPYWINSIRKYVKKVEPYMVISFAARINALVQLACVGLKTDIIVSERSDPWSDGRELPIKMLNRLFYPKAKKVVLQTKGSKSYFKRKVQSNCVVIRNPISIGVEASSPTNNKIVSVGRLSPEKNHEMLIHAFIDVRKENPQYELWIYGEGPYRDVLERLINELHLNDAVFLPGMRKNIHQEIADAEVFVLSSNYEGLSNALMEAMMMGLPCISTDVGGASEIIENNKSGIIVETGDVEGMAGAIEKVLSDKELSEKIAENGKEYAEQNFCVEKVVKQWIEIIEQ